MGGAIPRQVSLGTQPIVAGAALGRWAWATAFPIGFYLKFLLESLP